MKKFLTVLLILISANLFGQNLKMQIEGKIDSVIVGKKVFLVKKPQDKKKEKTQYLDSANVNSDGTFLLNCNGLKQDKYQLRYDSKTLFVFMDQEKVKAVISNKKNGSVIIGSRTDSIVSLYDQINFGMAFVQLGAALASKNDTTAKIKINKDDAIKALTVMAEKKTALCKKALVNPGLSLAYIVLNMGDREYTYDELKKAYSEFSEIDKNCDYGKQFKSLLDKMGSISVGGKVPDFEDYTPEGKTLSLYSVLKGKKVVLIDFWASWCGPCRKENPNVLKIYNENKDKGFDIISISLDDKRDNWINAIKKDQMSWNHVSDLKGWEEKTAKFFNVTAVPTLILVDGEGNVIAKNLRGEELAAKVKEICNK